MRLAGVVLAGGNSARMGRDKASLTVDGVSLGERALAALLGAGAEPAAISGPRGIPDLIPEKGPLGGILSSLHAFEGHDGVLFLPCDLSMPSPEMLFPLGRAFADLPAVCCPGAMEPLCALVPPGYRERIGNAVKMGHLCVGRFWRECGALMVPMSPHPGFSDWDTPLDFSA